MRGLKTLAGGLIVAGSLAAAAPIPHSPTERAQVFATCAGRLSALEQHQWLADGPASEATARLRDTFLDMLDAVLPDARARGLPEDLPMALRVQAKAAQAALLTDAAFATEPLAREAAHRAATALIQDCRGLILESLSCAGGAPLKSPSSTQTERTGAARPAVGRDVHLSLGQDAPD